MIFSGPGRGACSSSFWCLSNMLQITLADSCWRKQSSFTMLDWCKGNHSVKVLSITLLTHFAAPLNLSNSSPVKPTLV
uniref:Putative secreted protein n=1 Tax=Rhipicephalus microplus TaxID=6941 RepID=A0A6G5A456_RHIMP